MRVKRKYLVAGVLAIALAVAAVATFVPEAHVLAFATAVPLGHVLLANVAGAIPLTSKSLRAAQARYASVDTQLSSLLAIINSQKRNATAAEALELERLRAESSVALDALHEEQAAIRQQMGEDGAARGALEINGDGSGGWREPSRVGRGSPRTFRAMFGAPAASDWRDMGEFMGVLHSGLADGRLMASAAGGSEGVGTDGGFLIPPEFAATLMDASLENEIVRPRARIEPMKYSSKTVAGLNTQDHTADIGGVNAVWQSEGQTLAPQKPRLRALTLNARKLGILLPMSNEWVSDAPDAEDSVRRWLTAGITWGLDYAFLNGDGAGEPKGVLNDSALIVVTKESGQASATITYENIKAMYTRLHPACVPNACWIVNQGARAQLLGLVQYVKNAAGTDFVGGSGVPIVKQSADGTMSLLGLPLLFTEKVPALGSQGDIILTDLSQYIVGMRQEATIAKSQHLYFDSDQTAYRMMLRAEGRGAWSQAMQPKNGATLSWCVALQAR